MRKGLVDRIRRKTACIAIIGLGRVGLPTAVMFANAGYRVIGADVRKEVVDSVSSVKSRTKEPRLGKLIKKVVDTGKLKATTNIAQAVRETDVAIICVQTPLTNDDEPDLSYLKDACESVAEGLSKKKLVVIESTVPAGTMRNIVTLILEVESGLKCGKDFWLVYSPERIASGKVIQEFAENARVVGGYDTESAEIAAELLKMVTKGKVLVTDLMTAEVTKLAENTFRDVNIAFANELALICEQVGVDVIDVIRLANTHPRVNVHRPGCGVGGPCITKDPNLLLHSVRNRGFKSRIIEPSRQLNDHMPVHTVELIIDALKKAGKDVRNSRIVILGVAYKGESDDSTNTPAERIIRKLMGLGAEVVVYDPYCEDSFGARKARDIQKAVDGADCIVIATDHKAFEELKLGRIKALMNKHPVIIDGRRIMRSGEAKKQGFTYLGIGYGVE